jgi:hypothetical protein
MQQTPEVLCARTSRWVYVVLTVRKCHLTNTCYHHELLNIHHDLKYNVYVLLVDSTARSSTLRSHSRLNANEELSSTGD